MTLVETLESAVEDLQTARVRVRPKDETVERVLREVELAVREVLEKARAGLLEEVEDEEPDLGHDDDAEWRERRRKEGARVRP